MQVNLADLLRRAGALEPDKLALSEAATGRAVTWRQLDELADRVATGLAAVGMVAGYRMMLATVNRIEFVAAYLGGLRAGAVVVPVNPRGTTGELIRMMVDSGTRLVIADEATIDMVRQAVSGLEEARAVDDHPAAAAPAQRIVVVGPEPGDGGTRGDELPWERFVAEHAPPPPPRADPEALAVLLYTSGTSGRPRGAMVSHRALAANVEQVSRVDPPMITGRDVVLGVLPLFHVYGLNAVLGQVVRQCARLVLVDGFDAEGSLDLIEDEAVSVVPVAPAVFGAWMRVPSLEERVGPVRLVLSGSAPLDPDLARGFTERTGVEVHQGYGLTEASPVVTSTLCSEGAGPAPRSVGAAVPGVELRLVDEAGAAPAVEDSGVIHVRGDNLFSGYWPDGSGGPGEDGWFATGDVGYLDPDGDLYLVDRVKELVIVSGFNVFPVEVEEVVEELPEVAEAAVIGVPDLETGEAVVLFVRRHDPTLPADRVRDAVLAHCAESLARFKQPAVVHVVEELPHTVTGKVQKGRLREQERRRGAEPVE